MELLKANRPRCCSDVSSVNVQMCLQDKGGVSNSSNRGNTTSSRKAENVSKSQKGSNQKPQSLLSQVRQPVSAKVCASLTVRNAWLKAASSFPRGCKVFQYGFGQVEKGFWRSFGPGSCRKRRVYASSFPAFFGLYRVLIGSSEHTDHSPDYVAHFQN